MQVWYYELFKYTSITLKFTKLIIYDINIKFEQLFG